LYFLLFYLKVDFACVGVIQPLRGLLFVIFYSFLSDILSRPGDLNTRFARLRMSGATPPLLLYTPIEWRGSNLIVGVAQRVPGS